MSHKSSDRHSPLLRLTKGREPAGPEHVFSTEEAAGEHAKKQKHTERLTVQCWLLLIVNALFVTANALSGTFVGVFLWKLRNDLSIIGWFSLATHITMAITFYIAGKWVKEHNKMNSLRLGVAVSAVFYTLVLWLGNNAVNYVLLLGGIQGIASGFFWVAFNVVYFEVTTPHTRDQFNGWAGLTGSAAGMIAPWISGFIIVSMEDALGYRLIFTASLIIFVIGVIVSFFLKKRKVNGRYSWTAAFRSLKSKDSPWRSIAAALFAQGIREGVFGFLIGLLVYIHTGNEMSLGNFSLITSAVSLFSFMLIGKWYKPAYRKKGMLVGAIMLVLVILPFFWRVNFITLLVFGVGVSLFMPFYGIPMTSTVFDIIGRNERTAARREEYIVMRELFLNAGRIVGTLAFLVVVWFSASPAAMNWMILAIGSTPLLVWFFMRNRFKATKDFQSLERS